jgi:hypothetical protein
MARRCLTRTDDGFCNTKRSCQRPYEPIRVTSALLPLARSREYVQAMPGVQPSSIMHILMSLQRPFARSRRTPFLQLSPASPGTCIPREATPGQGSGHQDEVLTADTPADCPEHTTPHPLQGPEARRATARGSTRCLGPPGLPYFCHRGHLFSRSKAAPRAHWTNFEAFLHKGCDA